MQPLQWEYRPDGLRAPALICAFKGWNDAADAASSALTFVGQALGAQRFATIDPEEFYDFQATRPRIKLVDGQAREIVWPEVELYEARIPRAPRDLILLVGTEPSFRWRTFGQLVVELAEAIGAQLMVTLGALLADVPHTRPVSVTGLASDAALVARLGLQQSSYEGPTGIVGVLHAAFQRAGLPSGESVGCRPPLHRGRAEPQSGARARPQARGSRRRRRRRIRTRDGRGRLRAPGQRRGPERPRRAGVRRTARAGRRDRSRRRIELAPVGRVDRARPAAVPAPAWRRRRGRRWAAVASLTARPRDTRAGSRRSSTPRTTASARTPATGSPRRPRSPPRGSTPSGRAVRRHVDLLVVEHVVVGLPDASSCHASRAPTAYSDSCTSSASCAGLFGPTGLVVDQLVLAARQAVDAVDAAAQQVRARAGT